MSRQLYHLHFTHFLASRWSSLPEPRKSTVLLSQHAPPSLENLTSVVEQSKLTEAAQLTVLILRPAPFLPCESLGTSSRPSSWSMHSVGERIKSSTKRQDINMRQDVLPAATPAVKTSTVFKQTSKRHRRYVASNPSFWASLEEILINLILPGAPPAIPPKTRKPSEVLGWLIPCRRPTSPKPSEFLCSSKPTPKPYFTSRLLTIGSVNIIRREAPAPTMNGGRFTSRLVSIAPKSKFITKPKVVMPHKSHVPAIDDESRPSPAIFRPADKEVPLRIKVLQHRALLSGVEMPIRPVPVPVPATAPVVGEDSNSDDDEEQRRNAFEGWNEYD